MRGKFCLQYVHLITFDTFLRHYIYKIDRRFRVRELQLYAVVFVFEETTVFYIFEMIRCKIA